MELTTKTWNRYLYLSEQYYVLEIPANLFQTDEENALRLASQEDGLSHEEITTMRQELTALIAENSNLVRTLHVERLYDKNKLATEERFKEYYFDENGEQHWHLKYPDHISQDLMLYLKDEYVSTEFESEFSRVAGIQTNEFYPFKITVSWKSEDLMMALVSNGCYANIQNADGEIEQRKFRFFGASAGQLRKKRIVLIDEAADDVIRKQLLCGLDVDTINNSGKKINVSKFLAYNSLGMTASERLLNPDGSKFGIEHCIVVPDFTFNLNILADEISANEVHRVITDNKEHDGERHPFVDENANDGEGILVYSPEYVGFGHVLPYGLDTAIFRMNGGFKGLCSEFDVLKFCEVNKVEPMCKDIWGKEWNILEDNIRIIFTESQFKLAKFFSSWEEYCAAFNKYDGHICFLKGNARENEELDIDESEDTYCSINYQLIQPLVCINDEDIKNLLSNEICHLRNAATDRSTMLNLLGADKRSVNPRERALAYYPELIKLSEFRTDLADSIHSAIDRAKSSKFILGKDGEDNQRRFVIKDLYAFCEYLFVKQQNPAYEIKGIIGREQIYCRPVLKLEHQNNIVINEVALGRSPGLALDEVIAEVIHDNEDDIHNPYYWYHTDCVYIGIHDYYYLNTNCDEDGDEFNVITDKTYINALKKTLVFFDFEHCGNLYPGTKAKPDVLSPENFAKSILFASKANIGRVSNRMTKLWNAAEFIDNVNRKLDGKRYNQETIDKYVLASKYFLLYAQLNIDAAKNMFLPQLPAATEELMDTTAPKDGKKPYWFRYSKNFKNNEANRDKNEDERNNAVLAPNNSVCNKICKYVDEQMRALGVVDIKKGAGRITPDLSWCRGYDYKIFYGEDANTKRNPAILDLFKETYKMFFSKQRKVQDSKDATTQKVATDYIRTEFLWKTLMDAGYTLNEIYYTLVDWLFRDTPMRPEDTCGIYKYFWNSPCGEKAAQIIEQNVRTGEYDKDGSYVDRFRKCCPGCGQYFTPKQYVLGNNHGSKGLCPVCSVINAANYHAENNNKARDNKAKLEEDNRIPNFVHAVRVENVSEDDFIEFVFKYNKANKKIKQKEIPSIAANLGFTRIAVMSEDSINRQFKKLKVGSISN